MTSFRRSTHAGSWYSGSGRELNEQLDKWLADAGPCSTPARAIIAPHAGYSYSGACAAFAYRQLVPDQVKRVFILGPSHHVRLSGCALSSVSTYHTPLYDLPIDQEVYSRLLATDQFERMSIDTDENEHSIELHLPYIAKVMDGRRGQFSIVPVLVGSLSVAKEALYGRIFAEYLTDPTSAFVVSSDFCHWGQRFRYTNGAETAPRIHAFIERLDREAMDIIESLRPAEFADYLRRTGNTICGRHPIAVLLNAAATLQQGAEARLQLKFVKYAQSSSCRSLSDSSVSYASAALVVQ